MQAKPIYLVLVTSLTLVSTNQTSSEIESEELDSIRSSYDKCSPSECSGAAGCVTIYQHRNHRGWYQCYTIRKGQCEDFEAWWHESGPRVSSVNTHDTCIRLHSELGCKGQYIQVQPGSSHHGQLNKLQFEDRAVSVSSCDTTLSDDSFHGSYKKCIQSDCAGKSGCVTIFQHRNYRGWYQCYTIPNSGCATFESWWQKEGGRASSVDTHGTCIRLYQKTGCAPGPYIEIRSSTRHHENLNNLQFEDIAKSVGSCEKTLDPKQFHRADYQLCSEADCNGQAACATIFQHRHFGGWKQCYALPNQDCVTFQNWWVRDGGRVSSVNTHGTCVRLYDGLVCDGSFVDIHPRTNHHNSLNQLRFEDKAKSISSCTRVLDQNAISQQYSACSNNDCAGKQSCVTIYQHRYFKGYAQCYTMQNDECVNFQTWWHRNGARVSAVNTHGTCIRLHSNLDCTGLSLEVHAGTGHNNNLNKLQFEDTAQSVSSCGRSSSNVKCEVKNLFTPRIDSYMVSTASNNVLQIVDGITPLVASVGAFIIPGLDVLYGAIRFIIDLFTTEKSVEVLIDAKIEAAFARNSASQMNSKIRVITSHVQSILSTSTPAKYKKIELLLALSTCEEVMNLFQDEQYSFSQNKIASSSYLVAFSSVYLTVAKLSYEMLPEMRARTITSMRDLKQLNQEYLFQAKQQRMRMITWARATSTIHRVVDKLVCENYQFQFPACRIHIDCTYFPYCERCIVDIKNTISTALDIFFQPILTKLEKFPHTK